MGVCYELLDIEDKLLNYCVGILNKGVRFYFFWWKFYLFNICLLRNLFLLINLI